MDHEDIFNIWSYVVAVFGEQMKVEVHNMDSDYEDDIEVIIDSVWAVYMEDGKRKVGVWRQSGGNRFEPPDADVEEIDCGDVESLSGQLEIMFGQFVAERMFNVSESIFEARKYQEKLTEEVIEA